MNQSTKQAHQRVGGISRALADFVVDTRFEQLDREALRYARYALLDQLGVSLAATTLGEGCSAFSDLAITQGGAGESTLFASKARVPAVQAAFANGALSHALDFEDAHDGALVHPNAATIPAALAVAEGLGHVSGRELLTAIAVGCDVVCRLGLALQIPLDDYGWYPPPILSAFGATATAARLYGLSGEQVVNAFSLTLLQNSCSAEIKYNPHSQVRAIRDAFPAQTGVQSALLAARGITGFAEPFEGKAGFFAMVARGHYEPDNIVNKLGEVFEIAQLSFKAWPSCRGTHAYIEAALNLVREEQIAVEEIERIDVQGHRVNQMLAQPRASKCRPATAIDAKFSIPFCVASALIHGSVNLDSFSADARRHEAVLQLAEKVHYHVDDRLQDPAGMTSGRMRIVMNDGCHHDRELDQPYGSPARPLSEEDLLEKFRACVRHARKPLKQEDAEALAAAILSLEQAVDLQQSLFRFL
ncbi:MmgE/PrpD family protein [Gilvimarinus sp. F26214L]|uniref:MmgE/PrpD family protein n=1 Tax=Gilvimarinus sp. DZF01 TaxID=3461371 RepID=UPI004046197E